MYMRVCVYIGSNMHANSGHVRCHVTIARHSTAVVTLTANEFYIIQLVKDSVVVQQ